MECFQQWLGQNFVQPSLLRKNKAVIFRKILSFYVCKQFCSKSKTNMQRGIAMD